MLKRIKVRGKLLLLIATPLLAVLVFAFSGIADRTDSANFQERETRIAELADAGSDLSLAIQVERLRTIQADALGTIGANDENPLAAEQGATNAALARWLDAAAGARADIDDPALLDDIDFMAERLPANLTDDRTGSGQTAALVSFLALASRSVDEITASLVNHAADLELFKALSNHNLLQAVQSAYADVTSVGADALTNGDLPIVSATLLEAAERRITSNIESFNATADPEQVEALAELQRNGVLPSPASAASHPVEEVRTFLDDPSRGGFIEWVIQGEERLIALNGLIDDLLADATAAAAAQAQAANDEAQSFLVLAGSVVLLALVMALLIGRSISRPLIRLTRNAEQLSTEELPALVESMRSGGRGDLPALSPIEVKGRDEVAQLAGAISEIQQVTIDVAEEQGEMLRRGISDIFVNLARRNQSLLDRQIDFIDQLESREEDPDQLENLFRLDHLATRMRRNAESLLVLAGAEPSRRRGQPVEIADVMRVATGEIEDFSRIRLADVEHGTVAGSVAVDLAHLMSELMENATQFSPPDSDVDLSGRLLDSGSYELTLVDHGIGMSAEQLATANETLAEPPIVGLDLSRSLGFTVVSRLAHRLGVEVRLSAGEAGGVVASVRIPAEMLGSAADTAMLEDDHRPAAAVPAPNSQTPAAEAAPAPTPVGDGLEANAGPDGEAEPSTGDEDGTAAPSIPDDTPAPLPAREPSPFMGEPGSGSPWDAPATGDPGGELSGLPVRRPHEEDEGPKPLPTRRPGATGRVPAEPPAPAGNDLFAAFGSTTENPDPPADPSQDLFAPLAPAPGTPTPPPRPESTLPPPPDPAEPAGVGAPAGLPTGDPTGGTGEGVTSAGLTKRVPRQVDVPAESKYQPGRAPAAPEQTTSSPASSRSPEEVRQMLSRYRSGLRKGRTPDGDDQNPNRRS